MATLLYCYNKGCMQKFDPDKNDDKSCVYHPGAPVFHDASKKWSCCNKSSVDFTQFLQIRGCATGRHDPQKPPEPPKPERTGDIYDKEVIECKPVSRKPEPRPSQDEEKLVLNKQVDARLLSELDRYQSQQAAAAAAAGGAAAAGAAAADGGAIALGTSCQNKGCKATYSGPQSDREVCYHHPGGPVFHEGMKYWSCCQRKTSEFDSFMSQEGCEQGRHCWVKPPAPVAAQCRCDHHQGKQGYITLDVFAKLCLPEECSITANGVSCSVQLVLANGGKFNRDFVLHGVIDPSQSYVNMRATKVEILLKKVNAAHWPALELH